MAKEREKDAISIGAEGRRGDEVKSDEFLLRVSLGRFAQTRKKEKKKKEASLVGGMRLIFRSSPGIV